MFQIFSRCSSNNNVCISLGVNANPAPRNYIIEQIQSNLSLLTCKTILSQHVSSLTNFSLHYIRMTPTASHQLLLLVNYNRSMTNYGFENMRRNICYRHTFCINCKEFLYFYIMCCTVGRASEKCKNLFQPYFVYICPFLSKYLKCYDGPL